MRAIFLLLIALFPSFCPASIGITGITDKTKYDTSATFTVTADPAATTTTATLDGVAVTVGSSATVSTVSYHELRAESRDGGGALVDSKVVRFIVRDPARNGTEDGIPPFTPFRVVNDAPSAFSGGTLKIVAPTAWPAGLPIPLVAMLRDGAGEALKLNGTVTFGGFPQSTLQLRRGWGSLVAPAASSAGTLQVEAKVNGLSANPAIQIE